MTKIIKCRICKSKKLDSILDFGSQPLANDLRPKKNNQKKYPLNVLYCKNCSTSQLSYTVSGKRLFSKYFWVTATSQTARNHSNFFFKELKKRVKNITNVLEIASNDGTFLKPFLDNKYQVLGVDPAKNIAEAANKSGIPTLPNFFSFEFSKKIKKIYGSQSLIFARNVIPHVDQLHSVIKGISNLSDKKTTVAIEFHYSKKIVDELQYDSIYHEHLYYFSIKTLSYILKLYGLTPFDCFNSPISGGSIVLLFSKTRNKKSDYLKSLIQQENQKKINTLKTWKKFGQNSLIHAQKFQKKINQYIVRGERFFGYGASARSSTLLNFCKLDYKSIDFIIDNNSLKHKLYTPGSNIKIISHAESKKFIKNKNAIILAWNFKNEITKLLKKSSFKKMIISPF